MARDELRGQAYFDALVRANEQSIQKFAAAIANPSTTPEHRRRLRHTLFVRHVEQLVARYSRGEPPSSLRSAFPDVVSALRLYHSEPGHSPYDFGELDAYVIALWLLSIAILLDIEPPVFTALLEELDNEGRDALYERLVGPRVPGRRQATRLLHPSPYDVLLRALDANAEDRPGLIQAFLDRYYPDLYETYWHDSHLGEDAGFFGYWCFELAAAVKIRAFDDRAFRDHALYPRDLVGGRTTSNG